MIPKSSLEMYFSRFRNNVIGQGQTFDSPFGKKEIIYADWTASGRTYGPIEDRIREEILPFVANTHTETTFTGALMSEAYEKAKLIVKEHVHVNGDDILLFTGSGMTSAVNKLQRILGLRIPCQLTDYAKKDSLEFDETLRPIVFVTHMEHYSNHVSWLETIADVEIIKAGKDGNVDLNDFKALLKQFKHRTNKIAAITACSNVTGIETPYHEIAKLIHRYNGFCFVDFACSAPYADIDMHPAEKGNHLDAIYFSPHKFLGGPGTAGVLIFNKKLYKNAVPDQPGGGTLEYSNPWKVHEYISNIEHREDGGTPPILQGIKAAMCIRLKEDMGVENIHRRKQEILQLIFHRFSKMKNVEVLEGNIPQRMGVVAFVVKGAHYNLIAKILNDRFGIQVRDGCSCAGTYGHMLMRIGKETSYEILNAIHAGDLSCKPGWIRLSVHPVMSNSEIDFIMDAIESTAANYREWSKDYQYNRQSNTYTFKGLGVSQQSRVDSWFKVSPAQGETSMPVNRFRIA